MNKIIADRMLVDDDDELHFRDADAQNKLKNLIVQGKGDSETAVMSQAAATVEFDKLSEEIDDVEETEKSRYTINRRIRCVGMSIWAYDGQQYAGGYRGDTIARGYQTLLKERYTFDHMASYCYSGNSLGGLTEDDGNSIMNKSSSWVGSLGDIWLLDTITNDFKRNIPIGTFDGDFAGQTGITTYYGALKEFEKKVRALSKKHYTIIVANSCRRNNDGYTSTSINTAGHTLIDYEQALLHVASWNDWLFVDQYRCDLTDAAIQWATIDGLHLNNFGYTLAVRPWIECLDTLIEKVGEPVDMELTPKKYNEQGVIKESEAAIDWSSSKYIPVNYGEHYRYYGNCTPNTLTYCVVGYNENYNKVAEIIGNENITRGVSFYIPQGVRYIVICGYTGNNTKVGLVRL